MGTRGYMFTIFSKNLCSSRNKKEKSEYSVHYVKEGPKVDTNEAHYEAVTAEPVVATEPEYVSGMAT